MEPDVIRRFLESVGQKADIDLYLRLFRTQTKESFAILVADAQVVKAALDPLHFDLRILTGLGLFPVVLVGLVEPRDADRQARRVAEWLAEDDVPSAVLTLRGGAAEGASFIRATVATGTLPIVALEHVKELSLDGRFDLLGDLGAALGTRKFVFLSTTSGLEREGAPHISLVNLATDYDHLLAKGQLSRPHRQLLERSRDLLGRLPQRVSIAVVNPLQLLRELFTVSGAGTLIRQGSTIARYGSLRAVDVPRLRTLVESAFERPLRPDAWESEPVECVYVEENYLGAALLTQSPVGPYLSKFAVDRQAQGEGVGGDLWSVLCRDYPTFFWRSRAANPITSWYVKQCDGLMRFEPWHVFWRGLAPEHVPAAVAYARSLPVDFADDEPATP